MALRSGALRSVLLLTCLVGGTGCGTTRAMPRTTPSTMSYAGAATRAGPIPPAATRVSFFTEEDDQLATLRQDGAVLCYLPCTADVTDTSGLYVEIPAKEERSERLEVPSSLIAPRLGKRLRVNTLPQKGSPAGAIALAVVGGVLAGGGGVTLAACGGSDTSRENSSAPHFLSSRVPCELVGLTLVVPGVVLALAGAIWGEQSRYARLELGKPRSEAKTTSPFALGRSGMSLVF